MLSNLSEVWSDCDDRQKETDITCIASSFSSYWGSEACDQNQIGPSHCSVGSTLAGLLTCYCEANHFTRDGQTCIPCPSQPGILILFHVCDIGMKSYKETSAYSQIPTIILFDFTETCSDRIRNNHEIAIDCGGPYCKPCCKFYSRFLGIQTTLFDIIFLYSHHLF